MRNARRFKGAALTPLLAVAFSGCAVRGAPSFVIVGSYFPGWMFCALIGIISAIAVRVGFLASGLGVGSITDSTLAQTQLLPARNASTDAYSMALSAAATLALATGVLGAAAK